MPATADVPTWLAAYEPLLPLPQLVEEANKLFHEFEARSYDRLHADVKVEWAALWQEMIGVALSRAAQQGWRILDFGCGTGFASEQLLRTLPPGSVARICCYDLSPHMIEHCRAKLCQEFPGVHCCTEWDDVQRLAPFNLLATNSLLHHLPDPHATLAKLAPLLQPGAVWLAGHEPSRRFYRNPDCLDHLNRYHRAVKGCSPRALLRCFSPHFWSRRLGYLTNRTPSAKKRAARAAVERGLFRHVPPPHVLGRLVDFHVPTSAAEVDEGCGFDFEDLQRRWQGEWEMLWVKTYSYMGPVAERKLPGRWRRACRRLAAAHPLDGACFSAVWRRPS